MNESTRGFEGVGRWIAVASELPCSVVALLLVGQILGQSIAGSAGATWGAIFGALFGFAFGVYGVFKTIDYLEHSDHMSAVRPKYMPPLEEILEEVVFDLDDESSE